MINATLADLFDEMAELTKLEDENPQSFRARAYESVARSLRELAEPASEMSKSQLTALKGVGGSSADKVLEFLTEGSIEKLDRLRAQFPVAYRDLVRVPGLGAKTAAKLRRELDVDSVEKLIVAIDGEQLRDIPGLGAKTEEKLSAAIARLGTVGKERRTPIGDAMPVANRISGELAGIDGVVDVKVCGSLRRHRETVADVDILVACAEPALVANRVRSLPVVGEVIADGDTKVSFLTHAGLQVDVRVVAPESFGAAIMYFTGSKAHNIALRQRAIAKGWTLNEYALADAETGDWIAAATEADIYQALGVAYIPAPLREDIGEVDAAEVDAAELDAAEPRPLEVVTIDMMRGDLHVHSDLSGDGHDSMRSMVQRCVALGYDYMAFTDHAEDLTINGANRQQMLEQRSELEELADEFSDIRLLHGAELNIGPDGGVDYDPDFLALYDFTVASVHSHFDLSEQDQTVRLLTAMGNPAVSAIGHLSGRKIGHRPGIVFDVDAVLEGAEATRVAIEINASLHRLDASAEVIRRARGRGVYFVISTDAHRVDELGAMNWGVRQAQRGWLDPAYCVNTWPVDQFSEFITGD